MAWLRSVSQIDTETAHRGHKAALPLLLVRSIWFLVVFGGISMSTGSPAPQAPFARSAPSAASARESLPELNLCGDFVWLHGSRRVDETTARPAATEFGIARR
jgi:hypothetical protein